LGENDITEQIIGTAVDVHKAMGPGLLESIYQRCMEVELGLRGISFTEQRPVHLQYKGHDVGADLVLDLLVGGKVVVELKAVDSLLPVHEAQLLTYLKLTGCRVGLLINFNVPVLRQGVRRMVHQYSDSAPQRLGG
jgi:GxxExxY protein